MNSYLIVKILVDKGFYLPTTLVYGQVEFRPPSVDYANEKIALTESARLNSLDISNYKHCCRIAALVEADDESKATLKAEEKFDEVLDLKSREFPLSELSLTKIGFVKEMESGDLMPLYKHSIQPTTTFIVKNGVIPVIDTSQYVLMSNHELSDRYRRSLHWSRNSKHERNLQLKILFDWFAVEALFKENELDNVGPIIRWFLGFPNGQSRNLLPQTLLNSLSSHENYKKWQANLILLLDEIRDFRNESVHSGFRKTDFSEDKLKIYSITMVLGASRCQAAVVTAMMGGLSTVSEFKEYKSVIFENNENLLNDVHGNIIYMLENIL